MGLVSSEVPRMTRRKPDWARLLSGLYVPPYLSFAGHPCCCGCAQCLNFEVPSAFQIVIANTTGTCDLGPPPVSCTNWEGTFVLDHTPGTNFSPISLGDDCRWIYVFDPAFCNATAYELTLSKFSGETRKFRLVLVKPGAINDWVIFWDKNYTGKVDCPAISGVSLSLDTAKQCGSPTAVMTAL